MPGQGHASRAPPGLRSTSGNVPASRTSRLDVRMAPCVADRSGAAGHVCRVQSSVSPDGGGSGRRRMEVDESVSDGEQSFCGRLSWGEARLGGTWIPVAASPLDHIEAIRFTSDEDSGDTDSGRRRRRAAPHPWTARLAHRVEPGTPGTIWKSGDVLRTLDMLMRHLGAYNDKLEVRTGVKLEDLVPPHRQL